MTFFCNNNCVLRRSVENGIDVVQRFNRKVIVHFITYIEAPWFLDLSAIDPFIPYRTIRVLWRNKQSKTRSKNTGNLDLEMWKPCSYTYFRVIC